jgi:glycine/D-amino acid oxidase-like deaminating enzyme
VDVVIVGAGISGALVANELTQLGCDVLVLDRREPVHGSTLASSALLEFELDVPLHVLARRIGSVRAGRAYRRSVRSVARVSESVHELGLRCGFEERRSLYLAGDEFGSRALATEVKARLLARIGGRFLDKTALWHEYAIERSGAIESGGCAVVNPVQLAAGLLRRAIARGAHVCAPAEVLHVRGSGRRVHVETADGCIVDARAVVFCTGYELVEGLELPHHRVKSTWAIATRPVRDMPAWLSHATVWEASDPYLYVRTTADGRIVAGGEDVASSTMHTDARRLDAKATALVATIGDLLPTLECTLSHAWAGAFGESPTGLPLVDRVPRIPGAYIVAGFGGNGITHSVTAAEVVRGWIEGRPDPDAALYRLPGGNG